MIDFKIIKYSFYAIDFLGIFRRKKRSSPFNPFSEAQIQMLDQLKREVYKEIENYNRNQIKSDYDTDRVQRT